MGRCDVHGHAGDSRRRLAAGHRHRKLPSLSSSPCPDMISTCRRPPQTRHLTVGLSATGFGLQSARQLTARARRAFVTAPVKWTKREADQSSAAGDEPSAASRPALPRPVLPCPVLAEEPAHG